MENIWAVTTSFPGHLKCQPNVCIFTALDKHRQQYLFHSRHQEKALCVQESTFEKLVWEPNLVLMLLSDCQELTNEAKSSVLLHPSASMWPASKADLPTEGAFYIVSIAGGRSGQLIQTSTERQAWEVLKHLTSPCPVDEKRKRNWRLLGHHT